MNLDQHLKMAAMRQAQDIIAIRMLGDTEVEKMTPMRKIQMLGDIETGVQKALNTSDTGCE